MNDAPPGPPPRPLTRYTTPEHRGSPEESPFDGRTATTSCGVSLWGGSGGASGVCRLAISSVQGGIYSRKQHVLAAQLKALKEGEIRARAFIRSAIGWWGGGLEPVSRVLRRVTLVEWIDDRRPAPHASVTIVLPRCRVHELHLKGAFENNQFYYYYYYYYYYYLVVNFLEPGIFQAVGGSVWSISPFIGPFIGRFGPFTRLVFCQPWIQTTCTTRPAEEAAAEIHASQAQQAESPPPFMRGQ